MVNESLGMPDPTWRDLGDWSGCEPNPFAGELQLGQAVRVNYRDPAAFADQPIRRIDRFRVVDGMRQAEVRWEGGEVRTVPCWALIKA